ncbi:NAD(P)H-dependent oxidoreductase [Weeksellaceae bacterium A-14]
MKIIAFAGSNSEVSINRQLVAYAASLFENAEVEILDLNDYEMPIYKHERELNDGVPQLAKDFAEKFDSADLVLLSLAEHNGTYSTAFKNLFDWVSRIPGRSAWNEIPMFLMATASGPRGGQGVLETAVARFPWNGGNVVETFTLPFFGDHFDFEKQKISNAEKDAELKEKVQKVSQLEVLLSK